MWVFRVFASSRFANWLRHLAIKALSRTEVYLAASFATIIFLGAILLTLPVAHDRNKVSFLDALFTSTSAVCVTGLAVVDTGQDFSRFGHTVIMVLIQLGGLGILTFTALGAQFMGLRLSFRQQTILADSFFQGRAANQIRAELKWIVASTLILEAAGAALLYLEFRNNPGGHPALFSAAFHAVSAFCNAGFSLYTDNLIPYRSQIVLSFTIMALIVLGGLGHTVVLEMGRRVLRLIRRQSTSPVRWSLHSRVVLRTTAILIFGGAAGILLFGLTPGEKSWSERLINSLFQSVTARTAGFNTINIGTLPMASLLTLIFLMFIGGSPCSCAGGIKTTSAVAWYAMLRARLLGQTDISLMGRRLPEDVLSRAVMVVTLALMWHAAGCVILSLTELPSTRMQLHDLLFEQTSAFGTVGLSTGITPFLSPGGKLWIIASMFVGRIGPLTAALAVLPGRATGIRFTEERIMIG